MYGYFLKFWQVFWGEKGSSRICPRATAHDMIVVKNECQSKTILVNNLLAKLDLLCFSMIFFDP